MPWCLLRYFLMNTLFWLRLSAESTKSESDSDRTRAQVIMFFQGLLTIKGSMPPYIVHMEWVLTLWRRHGGQAGQLAPPPPTSDRTSREIYADPRRFSCRKKMVVGLQDLLPRFTRTDATANVLWSYDCEKRRSCRSCWRGYFGSPSVKIRGPLGSFSPGMGPPEHDIYLFFILNCWFGAPHKK